MKFSYSPRFRVPVHVPYNMISLIKKNPYYQYSDEELHILEITDKDMAECNYLCKIKGNNQKYIFDNNFVNYVLK